MGKSYDKCNSKTELMIDQRIKNRSRSAMARREQQYVSRFMLTVARGIILPRVKCAAISVEMGTTHVENVLLAGRSNIKNQMPGFILCLRYAVAILF